MFTFLLSLNGVHFTHQKVYIMYHSIKGGCRRTEMMEGVERQDRRGKRRKERKIPPQTISTKLRNSSN